MTEPFSLADYVQTFDDAVEFLIAASQQPFDRQHFAATLRDVLTAHDAGHLKGTDHE